MFKYVKTSELSGSVLDWVVAKCVNLEQHMANGYMCFWEGRSWLYWSPSTEWEQGGLILENAKIGVFVRDGDWFAYSSLSLPEDFSGDTPLIAAMRCFVAAHMGSSVSVPVELLGVN